MIDEKSYQILCQKVADQDNSCIPVLYDHYGSALYGVIYRMVNNQEIASELLQDTFVKIWQKGNQYDSDKGRLYTWMMKIAKNGALNHLSSKSHQQSKKIQSDDNLVYLHDTRGLDKKIESLDVVESLDKLDQKYKSIMKLIYLNGYTQQEISDEFDIPLGTVKSRVKIALRELKKIYEFKMTKVVIYFLILNSIVI